MNILFWMIFGIVLLATILCFYLLWRNDRVFEISLELVKLFPKDKQFEFTTGPSYEKMLYQFWKPITLEYWKKEFGL